MYRNLTRRGNQSLKVAVKVAKKPYFWSDKAKIEAVQLWLTCGSYVATATALKIPLKTLEMWRTCDWWKKLIEDIRTEGTLRLNAKLKTIVDKSLESVMDRLENGDWIYDQKVGELRRKPVSMRDAERVATSFIEHSQAIEKNPPQEEKKTEDSLAKLAHAFAQFAKKTTKIEVIDAVHVEREEGLQEGEEVGASSPETESGESGADDSTEVRGEGGEGSQGGQASSGSHQTSESWREQLSE